MSTRTQSRLEMVQLLRERQEAVLGRWRETMRARRAAVVAGEEMVDDIPSVLEAIADHAEGQESGPGPPLDMDGIERHATHRLAQGVELHELVLELAALRQCILQEWQARHADAASPGQVAAVSHSVDLVIACSVRRYIESRGRVLQAFDRIATAALESQRLHELLQRLLDVLLDASPEVDSGAILLREGDELVVKAAVGADGDVLGQRLRIGEGFAGKIASEGQPRLITGADIARRASPRGLGGGRPLRALYGVPLLQDGRLVGVAHLGSTTTSEPSPDERFLLRALADRATAGIVQHQLRQAMERKAAELGAVVEAIPEPVVVADHQGLRTANRAALALLGLRSTEEADARAATLGVLFDAREASSGAAVPLDRRPLARALAGETVDEELLVRRADSTEELIVRAAAAPVRVRGTVVAAVLVVSDLTRQRRDERERERLYREARQAIAARERVLAVVSHDLRSPLGTVLSAAAMVEDPDVEPATRSRVVMRIRRAVERMSRMVQDLLDMSSIEAGRLSVDAGTLDARIVVDDAVDGVRGEAEEHGCAVESDVEPGLPPVRGDRDRLVQVLGNVLGNALKVTPAAGRITVAARRAKDGVTYSVRDTGPGIPETVQASLFEAYERGRPGYKGTGLGLAIAKGIVEAHGGHIWIESRPGEGTLVCFTIPAA